MIAKNTNTKEDWDRLNKSLAGKTHLFDVRRATGRTFRKFLRVLLSVSEGNNVTFVTNKSHEAENMCRDMREFLTHQGIANDPSYKATRDSISFCGGFVEFIGLQKKRSPSYRPRDVIIDDCHYEI